MLRYYSISPPFHSYCTPGKNKEETIRIEEGQVMGLRLELGTFYSTVVCQHEDALDSWEAFKNGLSGLFGDCQRYTRRAEEQLKCRAQRSGESTQSYIQSVLDFAKRGSMREDEKVSHLMKGVAEDIYQAFLTREINDTASFIKWCNYIEDMKQKRVGRPRFERLPNVVPKLRRNFDDVGTEEEIRRPNSSRRFTPSPTRGRSPIRRYRSPSPYRRSSQSPGRRSEGKLKTERPSKEVRPLVLEILRRPPR
ncbi:retrotrans_gag domain-containing protein [Trichonephila clavipes]|nr:retrotrans_gag domain-containing protein [Trichonephila clavipes]